MTLALSVAFLLEAVAIAMLSRRLHSLESRTRDTFEAQDAINKKAACDGNHRAARAKTTDNAIV